MPKQAIEKVYSILRPDGSCKDQYVTLISDSELLKVIETIVFSRLFETKMMLLQRQGRVGFSLTSTGEEATIIGSAFCLNPNDPLFLSYRELGALLWRGVPTPLILNQFMGNDHDLCKGRQMPVHYCYKEYFIPSVSAPVGTQLTHACGYGYASKLQKTGQVSLAFLGEGTASGSNFHAALNFGGVLKSPCIFVIRNNGYAISTPESIQTAAESLSSRAEGYGIMGIQIDGNDLLAVIKAIQEAVKRARQGLGPTLIEAMTYRLGAHSSSDSPEDYRGQDETKAWELYDPLDRLIKHAQWRHALPDTWLEKTQSHLQQQLENDIEACEHWSEPSINTMFEETYETTPIHLAEQRDNYLSFLSRNESSQTL